MDINNIWWELNTFIYGHLMTDIHNKLYEEVITALGNLDNVRVDDFGCGTGELIKRMNKKAIIGGIDISRKAIEITRRIAKPNTKLYVMDFYSELPDTYKPDKIVACRSLYHPDLKLSLRMVAEHLSDNGSAIIVHPKKEWRDFINPDTKSIKSKLVQIVKSFPRKFSKYLGFQYNLFSPEEFKKYGEQFFNHVQCEDTGYGTHNLIILNKN